VGGLLGYRASEEIKAVWQSKNTKTDDSTCTMFGGVVCYGLIDHEWYDLQQWDDLGVGVHRSQGATKLPIWRGAWLLVFVAAIRLGDSVSVVHIGLPREREDEKSKVYRERETKWQRFT
jgi:hypothetical protein